MQMSKLLKNNFQSTSTTLEATRQHLSARTSQWLVLVDVKEPHVFDDVLSAWEHVVVIDTSRVYTSCTHKSGWTLSVSLCLSVCLAVCLSVCLSVCLPPFSLPTSFTPLSLSFLHLSLSLSPRPLPPSLVLLPLNVVLSPSPPLLLLPPPPPPPPPPS